MGIARTLLAGMAISALALGGASALSLEDKTVEITVKGFVPDRLEVTAGQKVVWKNFTASEHTVTAKDRPAAPAQDRKEKPLFDSGPIQAGGTWEHVFLREGTFEYFCKMDVKMRGTIVVKPAK